MPINGRTQVASSLVWLLAAMPLQAQPEDLVQKPPTGEGRESAADARPGQPASIALQWNRFRGPNGSGVAQADWLPTQWNAEDEHWRVPLPGLGHSSPVLWGERLFVTAAQEHPPGKSATRKILCLNARNGSQIWSRDYSTTSHRRHQFNSLASSTPAADDRNVYFCWVTADQLVATALDHNGNQVWQTQLGEFVSSHGYGMSPIVYDGLLIIGNDQQGPSALMALDARSGKVRWRVARDTQVAYSTPCLFQREDGTPEIIFTNWRHGISAVDPASGRTNWQTSVFQQQTLETAIASPTVAGGLIIGTCGYLGRGNRTVALRLQQSAPPRTVEVMRFERGAPLTTTPLAYQDCLFLWSDAGIVTCADLQTGEIHWRKRVGGTYYGSPVGAAGHVYCLSAEGEAVVLAASPQYRLIARNALGEGSHSTPAIARDTLYLRTYANLIAVGGRRPEIDP